MVRILVHNRLDAKMMMMLLMMVIMMMMMMVAVESPPLVATISLLQLQTQAACTIVKVHSTRGAVLCAEAFELSGVDYMTVGPKVLQELQAMATMAGDVPFHRCTPPFLHMSYCTLFWCRAHGRTLGYVTSLTSRCWLHHCLCGLQDTMTA